MFWFIVVLECLRGEFVDIGIKTWDVFFLFFLPTALSHIIVLSGHI